MALADRGRRVLLVSTDPASNLDEVLETRLGSTPPAVRSVPGLSALNIDPEEAARVYRERMVGPYRGVLPDAAIRSIEEQLSGACTVEIAAFDEFSKLLGDTRATEAFDHVVFDTAPTGHTLRLLELPAAWTGFLESNGGGTSCLGPLAGLAAQQALYDASRAALDGRELERAGAREPARIAARSSKRRGRSASSRRSGSRGWSSCSTGSSRRRTAAIGRRGARGAGTACARGRCRMGLASLPRTELRLLPFGLVGVASGPRLSSRLRRKAAPLADADGRLPASRPSRHSSPTWRARGEASS